MMTSAIDALRVSSVLMLVLGLGATSPSSCSTAHTEAEDDQSSDEIPLLQVNHQVKVHAQTYPPGAPADATLLHKRDALCKLMLPLWKKAGSLLGVKYNDPNDDQSHCDVLVRYYIEGYPTNLSETWSERSYYWFGEQEMIYSTIFKNADRSIRCNMLLNSPDYASYDAIQVTNSSTPEYIHTRLRLDEESASSMVGVKQVVIEGELDKAQLSGQDFASAETRTFPSWPPITVPLSQVTSFTFIREPAKRFVSAYSEVALREIERFGQIDYLLHPRSKAMDLIKDLLAFNVNVSVLPYDHLKYQLAPILRYENAFQRPMDIVGSLEEFDSTWSRLEAITGKTFRPYDHGCEEHPESSDEDFAPRKMMEDLVFHDSAVSHALGCAVLLPDFACLNYANLVNVQECEALGFHTSVGLPWDDMVKSIRELLCPDALRVGQ